jgi:hypothetical protein
MKGNRLFFDGYFNETISSVVDFVAEFLDELVKIRPDVCMEVDASEDGKKWIGKILENEEWGVEDPLYGYIEISNVHMNSEQPVRIKVFASNPKYSLWMNNLIILLEKHLKKYDGTPEQEDPLEKIPKNPPYLRKMVRLIREGLPADQIAKELCYSKKTIENRSSELRKTLGNEIVPYFQKFRNK